MTSAFAESLPTRYCCAARLAPVFLDVEAFNRGETGRQADLVEQGLRKGSQVFIEGHLKLDQWTSQDGQKRSKIGIVVDNFQFLDPRGDGPRPPLGASGSSPPARAGRRRASATSTNRTTPRWIRPRRAAARKRSRSDGEPVTAV